MMSSTTAREPGVVKVEHAHPRLAPLLPTLKVEDEEEIVLVYHSRGLSEEEAMKLAMEQCDLEEMGWWEGFSIQLRESTLARWHTTPPTTPRQLPAP
jgi:hypothetical protein